MELTPLFLNLIKIKALYPGISLAVFFILDILLTRVTLSMNNLEDTYIKSCLKDRKERKLW